MTFGANPTGTWHFQFIRQHAEQDLKDFADARCPEPLINPVKPHLRRLTEFMLDKGIRQLARESP